MRLRVKKRKSKPQHQMAVEIDTCIELIKEMEQVSEAEEDTSYETHAVIVMQALTRIQHLMIPHTDSDAQTALSKTKRCNDELE